MAMKIYNKVVLKKQPVSFYDEQGLIQMKTSLDQVYNEIRLWEKLDHKNIVKIFELFDDHECPDMYLIMQYADLGQLAKWNSSFNTFERNEVIYQKAVEAGEMKYLDGGYSDAEIAAKHIFR
jgi:serine/threonine protein kinase